MIEQILSVLFVCLIAINLSWIILYFLPEKKKAKNNYSPQISIILPAHNEEDVIERSVLHALEADYSGEREVLVVDDGSTDRTADLVKKHSKVNPVVRLISLSHGGKSNAINTALAEAKGEIVVVVDADSRLSQDALNELVSPFSDESVGAVSGAIRAEVNANPLVWYQDIEYLMSSTWRYVCNKLDATYLLPGFTAFRKSALREVGGFARDTLAEDFEIGLRIKKAGYDMVMSEAVMYTHVPQTLPALIRQRLRWSRGTIQVVRKHSDVPFNRRYGAVGLYGIPTQLYWFMHGFIALPLTAYQILYGYAVYFAQYSDFFSFNVFKYFFGWVSVYGMAEYSYNTFAGIYPMTHVFILCFISFILGTAYTFLAIVRYSKITWKHLFAIFFAFPYSVFSLAIFMLPLIPETLTKKRKENINVWSK